MARYDLTDAEWSVIQPVLPQKSRGFPRVDDRRMLNGIFWVLRSGVQRDNQDGNPCCLTTGCSSWTRRLP